MTNSDPRRDRIAAVIRALRAKTVENGCTEAEALAAAEKLAQVLRDAGMTLDEAEMRQSPFDEVRTDHDDAVGERLWKVADAISHLTGARYWAERRGEPHATTFFGFAHEVDVAVYLLEICRRAMQTEQDRVIAEQTEYRVLTRSRTRRLVGPFLDGMADRLGERIRAMREPEPTGTGLVVLRGALIDEEMARRGRQTTQRSARNSHDWGSYNDGRAAGDRVGLNRGLGGRGQTAGLLG